MTDVTTRFFDDLSRKSHEPLLRNARGSVSFAIGTGNDVERWRVDIDRGDVVVSSGDSRDADCALRTYRVVFARLVNGEANAMAAFLRGAVSLEGDPALLLRFQRIFPGPPRRTPS